MTNTRRSLPFLPFRDTELACPWKRTEKEGWEGREKRWELTLFFQPAASHSSIELKLRVTHTHTPSSDLSITDLRIFFFYLFELILSSRVRNWIARNKSAASYFGGARLDQGVPWTILLLFIWTIFRGGRSMVGCQTQTGNIRDFETV